MKKISAGLMLMLLALIPILKPLPLLAQAFEDKPVSVIRHSGFFYSYPLLDCELDIDEQPSFKKELEQFIENSKEKGDADRISVYFRQLRNGYVYGYNEDDIYTPASMLKVSNMMYVLREASKNPGLLEEKIKYTSSLTMSDNQENERQRLQPGQEYTVAELVSEMILFSNNEAMELLKDHFRQPYMWKLVFRDVGYNYNTQAGVINYLSIEDYSILFRMLFNATYLNREMSLKALDLLCRTSYKNGIVEGVGNDTIPIASKFGYRKLKKGVQLHECAIVYYEDQPYLIGIMTKGTQKAGLEKVISGVANIVHKNYGAYLEKLRANETYKEHLASRNVLRSQGYDLCYPLLDCGSRLQKKDEFEKKIRSFIEKQKAEGKASQISVYFKLLSTGQWFGIDVDKKYSPASIVKVPHMIVLLRQAQRKPETLYQLVKFEERFQDARPDIPDQEIQLGESYSLLELIRRMIVYSDNQAADLLFSVVADERTMWDKLFTELAKKRVLERSDMENVMTPMDIADFFAVLYNATYLNREMSELALEILLHSKFKDGIRKGVNNEVMVASKFGERKTPNEDLQLHECGIVYYDVNPYLVCIMTRGDDYDELKQVLEEGSRVIYEEIQAEFPPKN